MRARYLVLGFGTLFLIVVFVMIVAGAFVLDRSGRGSSSLPDLRLSRERVGVVEIRGLIVDSRAIINELHRYRDDRTVQALILRINSPGGAVVPSQDIYREVWKIRESAVKPIVASLETVAASGGYYIASTADVIVANPGTITGSIGVIAEWVNYEELYRWAEMEPVVFKSGKFKDAGSPLRDLTDEEADYFQLLVAELHDQFVSDVAKARDMPLEDVQTLADGRVFTGSRAKELGLVDDIGNLDDAVQMAAELAGIEGKPEVLFPRKRDFSILDLFLGVTDILPGTARDAVGSPISFAYRWR